MRVPGLLCCRKGCFAVQTEIKPLPWLGVQREVRSGAGCETGRSEQESQHPSAWQAVSQWAQLNQGAQLMLTPAAHPQEERSPFHHACLVQPRPPKAVGRDIGTV